MLNECRAKGHRKMAKGKVPKREKARVCGCREAHQVEVLHKW